QSQADFDHDGSGDVCDPDIDNDGWPNAQDCANFVNSVHSSPVAVGSSLSWSSKTVLNWTRAPQGNTYNVYRGSFPASGLHGNSTHTGFEEASPDQSTTDSLKPAVGGALYYLVSARNRCGESSLGSPSGGGNIPNGSPCVLNTSRDTDGDTVVDVDDN